MPEVTLAQMLKARDDRVQRQQELLSKYRCPLICFTMNIAGPIKTSPLIERGFFAGLSRLSDSLPRDIVRFCEVQTESTGCQAMLSVEADATVLKNLCVAIEEETPLGRLFDMDVLDGSGVKIEREVPRSCIVCGAAGRGCAAGRLHTMPELQAATNRILCEYFLKNDAQSVAELAVRSLLDEVHTTPKPGLVDRRNNGSHTDMDIATFIASANALKPYFSECVAIGQQTADDEPAVTFRHLREAGLSAEKAMFAATNGVNTHKGIIFTLGALCGGIGRLWRADTPFSDLATLCAECAAIAKSALDDWDTIADSTAGLRLYRQCGLTGIRGEVAAGLPSVVQIGLPAFKLAQAQGLDRNDAGAVALLHLITGVEDTVLYHRGGSEGAAFAVQETKNLLSAAPFPNADRIAVLDDAFIERNLSPGGCADLLAVTYFLHDLYNK